MRLLAGAAQVGHVGGDERAAAHQVGRFTVQRLAGAASQLREVGVRLRRARVARRSAAFAAYAPSISRSSSRSARAEAYASWAIVIARPTASSRTR